MTSNVKILYFSSCISIFATNLGSYLISFLVYEITGSKLATGGVWMIISITQLVVQFALGPFLDNWSRKKILVFSESFRVLVFLGVLVSIMFLKNTLFFLYISVFLINISVFEPVANALIPNLVNKSELKEINAKFSSMQQLMRIFGTMSAGFANMIGIRYGLVLVISMFTLSTILVMTLPKMRTITKKKNKWSFQFKKGLYLYKEKRILLYLTILLAISNFSTAAVTAMSMPYVFEILNGNSISYSFYTSAWSVGYILGSSLYSKILLHRFEFSTKGMIVSLVVGSLSFLLLSITDNIIFAIFIEGIVGLISPLWNIQSSFLYQIHTPEDIRAQIFSLRSIIGRSISPLGILFGTFYSSIFGVQQMMITVGLLSIIGYAICYRKWHFDLDKV